MPALALGLRAVDQSCFALDVFDPRSRQLFESELSSALLKELRGQKNSCCTQAQAQDPNWDDIGLSYGQFYWVIGRSTSGSVYYVPDISTLYSANASLFSIDEDDLERLPILTEVTATVDPDFYRNR